jgi:hypothetical protein
MVLDAVLPDVSGFPLCDALQPSVNAGFAVLTSHFCCPFLSVLVVPTSQQARIETALQKDPPP